MPTRIATLGRERTVATLARRLYGLDQQSDATAQARAEAALLRANPRLASRTGFESGARVVVPAVPGLTLAADVQTSRADGEGLADETALNLAALQSRITDGLRAAADTRARIEGTLSDRNFVARARRALPESAEKIAETRTRLAREATDAAAFEARTTKAIEETRTALERLRALARRG